MYLVLLKNVQTQKQCIYDTKIFEKGQARQLFTTILETLKSDDSDLELFVAEDESYCEIYKMVTSVNVGYLWNSSQEERQVLFLITLVPVFKSIPKITVDASCQTSSAEDELSQQYTLNYAGYANNCFLQANPLFTNELKFKLSLPNYGLRSN